jgi:hypothetical protein
MSLSRPVRARLSAHGLEARMVAVRETTIASLAKERRE